MSFDKSKATFNAERYLAQGKISAAISEYKKIVANDPRDIATLNMLGDLHIKNSDENEAVRCYTVVADHYRKQGFAQKAIAVYKKIARLRPNSVEISEKLAELYKTKGSVLEAKSHYATLAEHFQSKGQVTEALAIWKQVMLLDPNNSDVCLSLGRSYLEQDQPEEAANAFYEAGSRLVKQQQDEGAIAAFREALSAKPDHAGALNGLIRAKSQLGRADDAVKMLETMIEDHPHNREVLNLLIDSNIAAGKAAEAEKFATRLVEQDPVSYPKFLELVKLNTEQGDMAAAARNLALCSENLLIGGRAEELKSWIEAILEQEPKQLGALRLQARYYSWHRNDEELLSSLEALAEHALSAGSIEDERYALSQLVMIAPQRTEFADKLREINELHNFDENPFDETILKEQFLRDEETDESSTGFAFSTGEIVNGFAAVTASNGTLVSEPAAVNGSYKNGNHADNEAVGDDFAELEQFTSHLETTDQAAPAPAPEKDLTSELDSVKFYISNEYFDLAEGSLNELAASFGEIAEIVEVRELLRTVAAASDAPETAEQPANVPDRIVDDYVEPMVQVIDTEPEPAKAKRLDLSDLRNEFGLDEPEQAVDEDYETNYQLAVAYQEMGLIEEAIKGYQEAIAPIAPNDGTRRFFQCSILLGHCFMQQGMAKLALKWLNRAMETEGLSDDEKQGVWYELANAYEADGDTVNAARYFEQIYAENVDYRDVGERVKNLLVAR